MSMNFPVSPSNGDTYTLGTKTWKWNGTAWDLVPNAVAANTLLGNNTASTAAPIGLTATQVKTLLAIAAGDVSGLGTLATQNGTFSGTSSGTNTGDQTITLTGDVTGSGTGSFIATIASGAVTLSKMALLASNSLIGNNSGSTAAPTALSAAQVKTLLAIAAGDVSGFDAQVHTSRLDQMAAPTSALSLNSQRLTNVATPTTSTDGATRGYVDLMGVNTTQTANYTFVLADLGQVTPFNSASNLTATIPVNSSVNYPIGAVLYIEQRSTGTVSFVAGAGVTINTPNGAATSAKGDWRAAVQIVLNEWDVL